MHMLERYYISKVHTCVALHYKQAPLRPLCVYVYHAYYHKRTDILVQGYDQNTLKKNCQPNKLNIAAIVLLLVCNDYLTLLYYTNSLHVLRSRYSILKFNVTQK